MIVGEVIGTIVATRKEERLSGLKLLIVKIIDVDLKPTGQFLIAVDAVGAGDGETVLCAQGSSARLTAKTKDCPVDAVIMGIVDTIEIQGKPVYEKYAG
ncbi:MAG: EutN/CcmL family microcompartment protein [Candidatus Eisenbacteria bacterium]